MSLNYLYNDPESKK